MRNKLIFVLAIVVVILFAVSAEQIFAAFQFVVMWSSTTSPTINQPFTVTIAANDPIGVWEVYLLHWWWDGSKWVNSGWKNQLCNQNVDCERSYTVTNTTVFDEYYEGGAYNIRGVWQWASQSPLKIRVTDSLPSSQISSNKSSVVLGESVTFTVSAQDKEQGVGSVSMKEGAAGTWLYQACLGASPCAKTWTITPSTTGIKDFYGGADDFTTWVWASPKPLSITVTQPDTIPPTGSITASPSSVVSGQTITITMNGSDNVGVDRLFWNEGNQTHSCGGTTSCTSSGWSTTILTPGNYTFSGRVYDTSNNSIPVTSSKVTVTAADTTPPTVSISGSPVSWQNTNATATINCSDASGCESSSNWRFMTPTTNSGICSTDLSAYTGTYPGPFFIQEHRWMCATARDASPNANRGFTSTPVEFKVEKTVPTSSINGPAESSWQATNFTVLVSDSDSGGSGLSACYYGVYSDPAGWTVPLGTARTCGSVPSITVGATGNCPDRGENKCQVQIYSRDTAGNNSAIAWRTFSYSPLTLTYPSGTWQRLWYWISGASPNFTEGTFKGEDFTQTLVMFNKDYTNGVLPDGGQSYARPDNIGFRSSRTIYFPFTDLFRFTLTSDDGVRLLIDENPITLFGDHASWQDKGSGSGVYTADVRMSAGDHKFQIDYYENIGNAKVSFDYGASPITCPAPRPLSFNVTGTSIEVSWSPVLGAESYRVLRCTSAVGPCQSSSESGFLEQAGTISPVTSYTFENLTPGETYSFNVRVQTDNNTVCNAAGEWTNVYRATTSSCRKTASLPPDDILLSRSSCSIQMTHLGRDVTDNSDVKYERLTPAGSPATIEMDDEPVGGQGCDLDLKFTNSWTSASVGKLSVGSTFEQRSAANDFNYGYKLSSNNCVVKEYVRESCSLGNVNSSCFPPTISGDKREVQLFQPYSPGLRIPQIVNGSRYEYTFVECTQSSQCTADPNKAKCNLTSNTCVDSVPPTITIGEIKRTHSGLLGSKVLLAAPETPGTDSLERQWLRDGKYEIPIIVQDNVGGSDVDTNYRTVVIKSLVNGREFSPSLVDFNKFSVWIGDPESSLNDCVDQGEPGRCRIFITARDLAGNDITVWVDLKIDYTPPTAQ